MDAQLFMALSRAAEQRICEFAAQELANTAWACATVGIQRPRLMQKVGASAFLLIGHFDPVDFLQLL